MSFSAVQPPRLRNSLSFLLFLVAMALWFLLAMPLLLFDLVAMANQVAVGDALDQVLFGNTLTGWVFKILMNITMTFAPLFGMVGSGLCACAPPRSETRGTVVVSLAFEFLSLFLALVQLLMWTGWIMAPDARLVRLLNYLFLVRLA